MSNRTLKFTFIANACGIFTGADGTRLLCDPWLVDGVFEGSWCHFEPLKTRLADVQDVDAIFLSHLHPDHFDSRHFDFARDKPIVVLDHGPNFLSKVLERMGFTNLLRVKDGETVRFRELELTLFAPFAKHNFHEAEVGNLIDSALLVRCEGRSALNANDNTLSVDAARNLRLRFGQIDLAMLNYNAAGPYPSCFNNLSHEAKLLEQDRILQRNFDHMAAVLSELRPRAVLPFAGAYVLGGRLHGKNDCLGTTTWDVCAESLRQRSLVDAIEIVLLREQDTLDLEALTADRPYRPIDVPAMKRYIEETLSQLRYPYEHDDAPNQELLLHDIGLASARMAERMGLHGIHPRSRVVLQLGEQWLQIYPRFEANPGPAETGELRCTLDQRLLRRILDRRAHWNNAEVGAHIEFERIPNFYEPDLHTGLQFFHV